jgi:hypothetical protein
MVSVCFLFHHLFVMACTILNYWTSSVKRWPVLFTRHAAGFRTIENGLIYPTVGYPYRLHKQSFQCTQYAHLIRVEFCGHEKLLRGECRYPRRCTRQPDVQRTGNSKHRPLVYHYLSQSKRQSGKYLSISFYERRGFITCINFVFVFCLRSLYVIKVMSTSDF